MSFLNAIFPTNSLIKIGEKAPNFTLLNETGKKWNLAENLGKVIVLLFYPQNETLVCTKQLCSIRDNWNEYLKTKAMVIGISPHTIKENFSFSSNHQLPLPLLADANRRITKTFGQHQIFPIQLTRAIVVIDGAGKIRCRKIMLRALRPSDRSIIANIYAARTDVLQTKFNKLISEKKSRINCE